MQVKNIIKPAVIVTEADTFATVQQAILTAEDDLTTIGQQRSRIPVIDSDGQPVGIISRQVLKQILGTFMGVSAR